MTRPAPSDRAVVAAIALAALAMRVGLVFATPPFQAPDERAHLRFVEHLATERSLPVQPELDVADALRFWPQSYQPPLAYLLYLPTYAAARAFDADQAGVLRALRCQNAVYGALTVLLVYLLVARLTPRGDPRRLAAASVAAFLPGLVGNAAAVNNDALANLLALAFWLPLLRMRDGARPAVAAGALFGLACAVKFTVLPLAPLLFLVPWLERRDDPAGALRLAVMAGVVAGIVLLPVFVRNALVYGHPLAIGAGSFSFAHLAAELPAAKVAELAQPEPGRAALEVLGRFGIYLQLGWRPIYAAWIPLVLAALAGWLHPRGLGLRDDLERRAPLFAVAIALAALGLVLFSLRYVGGWQGRYLYPALLPIVALLAGGWTRLLPARSTRPVVVVLAVLLCALAVGVLAAVARFYAATPPLKWGFAGWL